MKTLQYLTDSEIQMIISALHIAKDEYLFCSKQSAALKIQFIRQSEQAEQLAEKIEAQS